MYGSHFNGYTSSFLTRRHDTRGYFEDTRKEEIDLSEYVDEKKDVEIVELSGVDFKEEILDIKDNLIINDETGCRDDCLSQSLRYFNSVMEDVTYCCERCDFTTTVSETLTQHMVAKHQGMSEFVTSDVTNICDQTQVEKLTNDSSIINEIKGTENGVFEEIDFF